MGTLQLKTIGRLLLGLLLYVGLCAGPVFAQGAGVRVNGTWQQTITVTTLQIGGTDILLVRDGAGILAQKNGTNNQELRIYGTTTGSKYLAIKHDGTSGIINAVTNTGGLAFQTDGTTRFSITATGLLAATDNTVDIGATAASRPRALFLGQSAITVGSGTGVTVNDTGSVRTQVYKITVLSTQFIAAAVTADFTVATLPAKTFLIHAIVDQTTTFACTAVCTTATLSAVLGKTAGGNQYLLSWDADAATGQFGDAAAELGASLAPATVPTLIGDLGSWSATTTVTMRLTSAVGNIGNGAATNLSQGTVTFYLTTLVMP